MNYSQQYEYLTFLAERTTQQVRMERIINEAVLIGEGADTIENIELIQESFSESVKKVIHKLLTFIGKLWGKFIEAMNTLIKNDKAYLERYKDIILKKKPADDIIIYDCVPVTGLTDSLIMSKLVDATVIVASEKLTPIELLQNTKKSLTNVGGFIDTCVM